MNRLPLQDSCRLPNQSSQPAVRAHSRQKTKNVWERKKKVFTSSTGRRLPLRDAFAQVYSGGMNREEGGLRGKRWRSCSGCYCLREGIWGRFKHPFIVGLQILAWCKKKKKEKAKSKRWDCDIIFDREVGLIIIIIIIIYGAITIDAQQGALAPSCWKALSVFDKRVWTSLQAPLHSIRWPCLTCTFACETVCETCNVAFRDYGNNSTQML